MALVAKSLMTYSVQVTSLNQNLDFKAASGGPTLTAQLNLGSYSPIGIAVEVARAMQAVDSANNYSAAVSYNVLGGTQNRITISSTGTFLSLLFASGPNAATSPAALLGYNPTDYTGATHYTGSATIGVGLITTFNVYTYLDDQAMAKVFGAVNVSASGLKESVVFNIQKFIEFEIKYEPASRLIEYKNFFYWAIQQQPFDFIPQITVPTTAYQVTLESTESDPKGLGYRMKEMLPNFPNLYQTGPLKLRIIEASQQFV